MSFALPLRGLEVADCRSGGGADRRWQRRGEDEAWGVRANRIDERRASGDVAPEAPEGLGKGALDHIDPVHGAGARSDSGTPRAVHSDGMDLVEIGHGAVSLGKIADATNRGDVTVHRIQALEDDQLRPLGV